MRIQFLKDVKADPHALPMARGAMLLRVPVIPPMADPETGQFSMPCDGEPGYIFPRGRVTEMDNAVAEILIGNGDAVAVECDRGIVVWGEE